MHCVCGTATRRPGEHRIPRSNLKVSKPPWENLMSKKAAEHHRKASEHLKHAARHHEEAAKHHDAGHHEKAAHHAHTARGHVIHGRGHAEEAVKAHTEEHPCAQDSLHKTSGERRRT